MNSPLSTIVLQNATSPTSGEISIHLALTGQLAPVLQSIAFQQNSVEFARSIGLQVTDQEVQQAANRFRYRNGLIAARDIESWLVQYGISLDQFIEALEASLLIEKLKQRLIEKDVKDYFAENQTSLEMFRYREIVCDREDLSSEILAQICEDGVTFAAAEERHQDQALRVGLRAARWNDLPAELLGSLTTANLGEIIGPLATPQGSHLLMLVDRRPAILDAQTQNWICNRLIAEWSVNRNKAPAAGDSPNHSKAH